MKFVERFLVEIAAEQDRSKHYELAHTLLATKKA